MPRLVFDKPGERFCETGVERVVLYRLSSNNYVGGVAWNGVTSIDDSREGGEGTDIYADDTKYLELISEESWQGTLEAYNYPNDFAGPLGMRQLVPGLFIGQQVRERFGFCYTTREGNDSQGNDYGYKLHLVYNVSASPSEEGYQTQSDSPEAVTMSWELSSGNVAVAGHKPTAEMTIDYGAMAEAGKANIVRIIEDMLYGTENSSPVMPKPSQIAGIVDTGIHLCDSDGNFILDDVGERIESAVYA